METIQEMVQTVSAFWEGAILTVVIWLAIFYIRMFCLWVIRKTGELLK